MRYSKITKDGYILAIGAGTTGTAISEDEYNSILAAIQSCPSAQNGFGYRLKTDLTWELYELPVTAEEADPELTAEEALDIILGGGSDA